MYRRMCDVESKRLEEQKRAINEFNDRAHGITNHNVRAGIFSEVCAKYKFSEQWLLNHIQI